MKNLETLIQELCPNGVEFVKIGDVIQSINTGLNPRRFFSLNTPDANNFYVTIREMKNGRIVFNNDTDKINDEALKLCNNRSNLERGDVLFSGTGTIGQIVVLEENPNNWNIKEGLYALKPIQERIVSKFLAYALRSTQIRKLFLKKALGGTVKSVPMKVLSNIEIPLPPIEVQTEIVRILDKFTSLEAELEMELEAELDCRKRQYEYYRDKLLSFDNVGDQEVEWKKMSEVSFYPKTRINASELSDNSYIGVENLLKDKLGRTDFTVKPEGSVIQFIEKDILIGNIRPYLRKIWKSDCKGGTNGDVLCIRVKEPSEVSPDYLFHILSSEKFFLYDIKNSRGAKMPRGDKAAVMDFEIPIPSLEDQHRIVSILDRFESLTTSLQSGLPAEIAARRQQYEHYRDKLLTFKRKGAA